MSSTMLTISTTQAIYIGTGSPYVSPFTITQAGTISTGNTHAAVLSTIASPSLSNAGLITDTAAAGVGVKFTDGGTIFNAGTISGRDAIAISGAAGTVVNAGSILAHPGVGYDIGLLAGGYVSNAASGTISIQASQAINIAGGTGTVVNAGTIEALGNIAINLQAGGYVSNAAGATLYGGEYGVRVTNNTGTVINAGTIISNKYGAGIYLLAGGNVTNAVNAILYGGYDGTGIFGAAGTVVNDGTIAGGDNRAFGGNGVGLFDGGTFTNAAGAAVYGYQQGVVVGRPPAASGGAGFASGNNPGTIVNSGNIEARLNGIYISTSGAVLNTASGTITGGTGGIDIIGNGTVTNAGTIGLAGTVLPEAPPVLPSPLPALSGHSLSSSSRPAIDFHSSGANRLIIDPGAVFIGLVEANATASNTMELASGTSAGTISGIGSQFTGFGTIQLDTGASWTLAGNQAGFNNSTISGFTGRDTINVTSLTAAPGVIALDGSDVLTIGGLTLTFTSADTGVLFTIASDGNGGTDITDQVMCFLAGTNIATPDGEVPVESLRIGNPILTADGGIVPVRWIGIHRAAARFADPLRVMPIRIKAGALGETLPRRDLLVSPDHAMYLGGILIQASALVNGSSIIREHRMPERFVYYHVETASHALILAEGAATETFIDHAGRLGFDNWAEYQALYARDTTIAEMGYPRAKSARQIPAELRRRLAVRATLGSMALSA